MKSVLLQLLPPGTVVLPLAVFLAWLPAAARAEKSVDETRPAAADGTVEIACVAGTIAVTGSDKAEVSVQGKLDDDLTLELKSEGKHTTIDVKFPEEHLFNVHRKDRVCDLTISVPQGSAVAANLVSADVAVSGVNGDLDLETVSGDLTINGKPDQVKAKSVSGDLKILATTPRVRAESVSGTVDLQGPSGEAQISSVSGDVNIQGSRFRRVEASTVSGNLVFDGDFTADGRGDLSSHSGSVELRLPDSSSTHVEAETFSGDIKSEFGQGPERTGGNGPGESLEFSLGAGEAQVKVNSFSGSVELKKK